MFPESGGYPDSLSCRRFVCQSHCVAYLSLIAMNWSLSLCLLFQGEKLSRPGRLPETLIFFSIRLSISLFFSVSAHHMTNLLHTLKYGFYVTQPQRVTTLDFFICLFVLVVTWQKWVWEILTSPFCWQLMMTCQRPRLLRNHSGGVHFQLHHKSTQIWTHRSDQLLLTNFAQTKFTGM